MTRTLGRTSGFSLSALLTTVLLVGSTACGDGTTEPPPPANGDITGTVTVEGGAPLAGITVSLSGPVSQVAQTDGAGAFRFDDVPEGSYTISVSGEGEDVTFDGDTQTVNVVTGQTSSVVFTATRVRNAVVTGTVRLDGLGETGRQVLLTGPEGSDAATTDSGGQYRFEGLLPGIYTVSLGGVDNTVTFESTMGQVTVGLGETGVLDFSGIREVFATAQLVAIEDADRGTRLSFDAIRGEVEVFMRVESGTRTLTDIRVRVNGELVAELDVSATAAATAYVASAAGARIDFRLGFDTGEFDPVTGQPRFMNGPKVLSIELETVRDGAFEAASAGITLNNEPQIGGLTFVTGLSDPGVVSSGRRWHGNQDLQFAAMPVLYSGDVTVGAVRVLATTSGAGSRAPLDFGSGPGISHVSASDLTFTATVANNAGLVQDDPGGSGHTIQVIQVLDDEGIDITGQFTISSRLENLYFDFLGPEALPTAVVLLDDNLIAPSKWFSSGTFTARDVVETGVGGLELELEAIVGSTTVASGVSLVDQLAERQREYRVQVSVMRDALGNLGDPSTIPTSQAFGVDRTPQTISNALPATDLVLNPDDDGGNGTSNNRVSYAIADPVLADGSVGAGFLDAEFTGEDENDIQFDLTGQIIPNGSGANEIPLTALPDGSYVMRLVSNDNAIPSNAIIRQFRFTIDGTDPIVDLVNPPAGLVTTANAQVGFTIQGSITDVSGLSFAQLTVRDGDSDGNGLCDITDTLIPTGPGPGQISISQVDLGDQADDFSQIISFRNAGSGVRQIACFFIQARDNALNNAGGPEANEAVTFARTVIDWI